MLKPGLCWVAAQVRTSARQDVKASAPLTIVSRNVQTIFPHIHESFVLVSQLLLPLGDWVSGAGLQGPDQRVKLTIRGGPRVKQPVSFWEACLLPLFGTQASLGRKRCGGSWKRMWRVDAITFHCLRAKFSSLKKAICKTWM